MRINKLTVILLVLPFLTLAQNLALNKPAIQSTTWSSSYASKAVDGNTSGTWGDFSITHTDNSYSENPWWRVDLESTRTINSLKVFNRSDGCCKDRLIGAKVMVGNTDSTNPNDFIEIGTLTNEYEQEINNLNIQARYVFVYLVGIDKILSLAEVEVYGSASSSDTQPPTAPTLSSTGQSETTADLSWSGATDNIGVTGYKVFKDGSLEATLGNVNSHTVTSLTASTTYSFTVTALDAAGNESPASSAVPVTTNASSGGSSGGGGDAVWSESGSNVYYSDGNVGIGTSNPSFMLDVEGEINASNYLRVANPSNASASIALSWSSNVARIRVGGEGSGATSGLDIQTVGDLSLMRILHNGGVGIGTTTVPGDYKLAVNGKIISEELKVQLQSAWPDYVFSKDYKLLTLEEIQRYILKNGHLPNIPSAQEVEKNGIEVGEMNRLLLEKIEELTLHIIRQENRIKALEQKFEVDKTN